jgi:hypothetical protein
VAGDDHVGVNCLHERDGLSRLCDRCRGTRTR